MSTPLRLLVRDLVDEVLTRTEVNPREECVEFDMGDSERAAFELEWEEKLRAAVLAGLDVRIPSHGSKHGGRYP